MNTNKNKKRVYRKVTPRLVANHATQEILAGNATQALRELEGETERSDAAIRQRATRIVAKRDNESAAEYIDKSLEQMSTSAIERVNEMLKSNDERIATKNAHYVLDQIRGKAVQRNISISARLNIQNVLD